MTRDGPEYAVQKGPVQSPIASLDGHLVFSTELEEQRPRGGLQLNHLDKCFVVSGLTGLSTVNSSIQLNDEFLWASRKFAG